MSLDRLGRVLKPVFRDPRATPMDLGLNTTAPARHIAVFGVVALLFCAVQSQAGAGMLTPLSPGFDDQSLFDFTSAGCASDQSRKPEKPVPAEDDHVPDWQASSTPDSSTAGSVSGGGAQSVSAPLSAVAELPQDELVSWAFRAPDAPRRPPHVSSLFRPPRHVS